MKTRKNIVFFSHSSRDAESLGRLREAILKQCGNAIEIFCSSDGESIPFGTHWIHKVEEALMESDLVFLFISPNSIGSQWVFFEAGYFYGQQQGKRALADRKIVPIGINGVDMGQLRPPISLLQGFTLNSIATLNNILHIIRTEFALSFNDFDSDVFGTCFSQKPIQSEGLKIIYDITFSLSDEVNYPVTSFEFFNNIALCLKAANIAFHQSDEGNTDGKRAVIVTHGLHCHHLHSGQGKVSLRIFGEMLSHILLHLSDAFKLLGDSWYNFESHINGSFTEGNPLAIGARLRTAPVEIASEHTLGFKEIEFRTTNDTRFYGKLRGLPGDGRLEELLNIFLKHDLIGPARIKVTGEPRLALGPFVI